MKGIELSSLSKLTLFTSSYFIFGLGIFFISSEKSHAKQMLDMM